MAELIQGIPELEETTQPEEQVQTPGPGDDPDLPPELRAAPEFGGKPAEPGLLADDPDLPPELRSAPELQVSAEKQSLVRQVGEQVETVGKSAAGGALKGAGFGMGAASGAVAGAAIGALGGPAAPVTVPLGAGMGFIAGGVAGYYAGDVAARELERHGLAVADPEALPPHLRIAGRTGAGLGFGLSGASTTTILGIYGGRLPDSAVGRVINDVLDTAKAFPKTFIAGETSAATQAGAAGGVYEEIRPGHPGERALVEIAVGALNPIRLLASHWHDASTGIKNAISRFSPAGKRTRAAEVLQEFIRAGDDAQDPEVLLRALRDTNEIAKTIPGFRGTVAQTTGDIRLAKLERELAERTMVGGDRSAFVEFSKRADETLEAISNAIALLRGTGDPEALRAAAQLTRQRYQLAIDRFLLHAKQQAVKAAQDVGGGATVADRGRLSTLAAQYYDDALKMARDVEKQLWDDVFPDRQVEAVPNAIRKAASALQGELTASGTLHPKIAKQAAAFKRAQDILERVAAGASEIEDEVTGEAGKITEKMIAEARKRLTAGEIMSFRSELLALARETSQGTGETALGMPRAEIARQLGLVAEAAMDDLAEAGVATYGDQPLTAFDNARAYSRQLHDAFDRTFAGRVAEAGPRGPRLPPELLLKRAFATGDEVGALQLRELADAIRFLPARELASPDALAKMELNDQAMMDVQARLLRIMASRTVDEVEDKATGEIVAKVSVSKARRFLREAGALLERFPEVKANLEAAVKSEESLRSWVQRVQGRTKIIDGTTALARVLKVESPADAVRGALGSPRPAENIQRMVQLARTGGPKAMDGLRAAVFDNAIRAAQTPQGRIGLEALVRNLDDPLRPGLPSLRDIMVKEGALTRADSRRIDQLLDAAYRVMIAVNTQATGEIVVGQAGPLETLLIRATGSDVGRRVLRSLSPEGAAHAGQSLIVAQRAAQMAEDLADRMPAAAVQKMLVRAMAGDPIREGAAPFSLFETLLTEGVAPAERLQRVYMLHAYAWQAGLLAAEDELDKAFPAAAPSAKRVVGGQKESAILPIPAPGQEEVRAAPDFERIAAAVKQVESGGDPKAVSPKGAIGTMQTMPGTLRDPGFGVRPAASAADPAEQERVGREYLQSMLKKYDGNLDHALAAYNWGPDNVDRWIKRGSHAGQMPKETRSYIKKVKHRIGSLGK